MGDVPHVFLRRFTSNREEQNALLIAMYNVTLFALLSISMIGIFFLYKMLYMFLSPMMWAILVGTLLFPFKRSVSQTTKDWLNDLEVKETPLLLGFILLPYNLFVALSDYVYRTATGSHGLHILIAYVIIKVFTHEGMFIYFIRWIGRVYSFSDNALSILYRPWVFPLIVLYTVGYGTWVIVQKREEINKKVARALSLPIWIYGLGMISVWFGILRVIVFGGCSIALGLISAGVVGRTNKEDDEEEKKKDKDNEDDKEEKKKDSSDEGELIHKDISSSSSEHMNEVVSEVDNMTGMDLLWSMLSLVILLWIVKHDSALLLLLIPLLYALICQLSESFGIISSLKEKFNSVMDNIRPSLNKLTNITVAGPLREFIRMLFSSDHLVLSRLRCNVDLISSIVVMIFLAMGTLTALLFVVFQVHGETVHLGRITGSLMSSHPDWLSSALNYTEDRLEEQNIDIDDYIAQGYESARVWLGSKVRSLADPSDTVRGDQLEKQVMEMLDNVYRMWEERNISKSEIISGREGKDWLAQVRGAADLSAMKEEITLIIKENIDTLMGIAQSVWAIFILNVSLLSSLLLSFTSLILSFGMDMLNFFIALVVFLTMVYYLLASSGERWLPLELLSQMGNLIPGGVSDKAHGFTIAIEDSIFGVFGLSCKMAAFYGLYTYFVHSLFDLNIVFIPSMLASLFAAIPIMAPWTVCIVGVIELWLVRSEGTAAILFTFFSFAPLAFADGKFYSEVKGIHPYVTGLSIIGGMYWLGLQGAIIGPLILCLFLVLINMYGVFNKVH